MDRGYHTGILMTTRHHKTATQQQQPQATSRATSSNHRLSAERNCIGILLFCTNSLGHSYGRLKTRKRIITFRVILKLDL